MAQTTFSVHMDEALKQQFDSLCADYGMNTSAAFTAFARAVVREKGILPFIQASVNPHEESFNAETIAALEEGEEMIRNPAKYPRYETFQDVIDEVLNET